MVGLSSFGREWRQVAGEIIYDFVKRNISLKQVMFSYQIKSLLVDSRNVFGFYFIYLIFWLRKYPIISNYRSHYTDKWSVEGNLMKCPTAEAKAINIYLDILKWQGV